MSLAPGRFALLLSISALAGCASMPRDVRLQNLDGLPPGKLCVRIEPLADLRPTPQRVGVTRNGFYAPTAEARTPDDLSAWITGALQHRLLKPDCSGHDLLLQGTIREAFVDEFWNLDAQIVVWLGLRRGNQELLAAKFEGRHLQLSHAGAGIEFAEALQGALKNLLETAVPALETAATRPPPPAL